MLLLATMSSTTLDLLISLERNVCTCIKESQQTKKRNCKLQDAVAGHHLVSNVELADLFAAERAKKSHTSKEAYVSA
jgi:hypothetical protein